ncbi:terpene synthase family protein [Chitinophaga sp. Ak27]|uniref:terpene synthase family protein n=1 Tax=Chitinophaga sp. Ak27 TaxID=2726116 RepID=UPI00145F761E|nr:hypothetical protein [Chitinophaga sp. Ak27]NLU94904.1 hypothetical protein [Chitinophaga sp. Ak27]
MNSIQIPQLYCPVETSINPFVHIVTNHTNQWVQTFELHTGQSYEKYLGDNFGFMTARFYPFAPLEHLCLANDINVLLFVMDDAMDNQIVKNDLITTRKKFEAFIATTLDILHLPQEYNGEPTGVFAATLDVWKRLCVISNKRWQDNFILSIAKMFEAALWEFDNVASGRIPTVSEFYNKRQFLGAAHISTDMIPIIEQIDLPEQLLSHPSIEELTVLARNAVCWANDLFSLSKEIIHGDQHNMVFIMQAEKKLSLPQAIHQTAALHDTDMHKFMAISKELPSFGAFDHSISRYVRILGAILKGNVDWSTAETKRYDFSYISAQ